MTKDQRQEIFNDLRRKINADENIKDKVIEFCGSSDLDAFIKKRIDEQKDFLKFCEENPSFSDFYKKNINLFGELANNYDFPRVDVSVTFRDSNILGIKVPLEYLQNDPNYIDNLIPVLLKNNVSVFADKSFLSRALDENEEYHNYTKSFIEGSYQQVHISQFLARIEFAAALHGEEFINEVLEAAGVMNLEELRFAANGDLDPLSFE